MYGDSSPTESIGFKADDADDAFHVSLWQVLEEVDVGPIPVGVNKFVLTAGMQAAACVFL